MKRIIKYEIFEDLSPDQMDYLKDIIKKFPHQEGDVHIKKLTKMMATMDQDFLAIKRVLDEISPGKWSMDNLGRIDIEGDFIYQNTDYSSYGFNFGKVTGDFKIPYTRITFLEGMPYEVGGDFEISGNKVGNLIGGPKKVGGDYIANHCGLTSLQGSPEIVNNFKISDNEHLSSLKGGPRIVNDSMIVDSCDLQSLKYAPVEVGKEFSAYDNKIESLEGCPKKIGEKLALGLNRIKSLVGITPEIGKGDGVNEGSYRLHRNQLKNLIGLPDSFKGSMWVNLNPLESLEGLTDKVGYISWDEGDVDFHSTGRNKMESSKEKGSWFALILGEDSEEVNKVLKKNNKFYDKYPDLIKTDWYKPTEFVERLYKTWKKGI
jgi:hypothetical protein